MEPHGHPVTRPSPINLRSGLGLGPKFSVEHIDFTGCSSCEIQPLACRSTAQNLYAFTIFESIAQSFLHTSSGASRPHHQHCNPHPITPPSASPLSSSHSPPHSQIDFLLSLSAQPMQHYDPSEQVIGLKRGRGWISGGRMSCMTCALPLVGFTSKNQLQMSCRADLSATRSSQDCCHSISSGAALQHHGQDPHLAVLPQ